jgi:hypothetical protein
MNPQLINGLPKSKILNVYAQVNPSKTLTGFQASNIASAIGLPISPPGADEFLSLANQIP